MERPSRIRSSNEQLSTNPCHSGLLPTEERDRSSPCSFRLGNNRRMAARERMVPKIMAECFQQLSATSQRQPPVIETNIDTGLGNRRDYSCIPSWNHFTSETWFVLPDFSTWTIPRSDNAATI